MTSAYTLKGYADYFNNNNPQLSYLWQYNIIVWLNIYSYVVYIIMPRPFRT